MTYRRERSIEPVPSWVAADRLSEPSVAGEVVANSGAAVVAPTPCSAVLTRASVVCAARRPWPSARPSTCAAASPTTTSPVAPDRFGCDNRRSSASRLGPGWSPSADFACGNTIVNGRECLPLASVRVPMPSGPSVTFEPS